MHDAPSLEKIAALSDFLATVGLPWNKGEPARTERFNKLLGETREGPHADIVNEVVLRTQMQAHYSPENIGHFGLNLDRYAHFTSPIRRYADLIVHRALVRALKLGDDGLSDWDVSRLKETADHITDCERRAMAAERDAADRYIAAYLSDRVGAEFEGRITGVTRLRPVHPPGRDRRGRPGPGVEPRGEPGRRVFRPRRPHPRPWSASVPACAGAWAAWSRCACWKPPRSPAAVVRDVERSGTARSQRTGAEAGRARKRRSSAPARRAQRRAKRRTPRP